MQTNKTLLLLRKPMAINLKTLATRSMSAAVFVILLVGCVYWSYISFSLFFFAVALIGLNEFYKISEKMGSSPYKILGFILGIITYLAFLPVSNFVIEQKLINGVDLLGFLAIDRTFRVFSTLILLGPFIILATALFSTKENSIKNALYTIGGIIYAVLPFALLNQVVYHIEGRTSDIPSFNPMVILGIIFLIWTNDTFAYLGGSLVGKNKMIERVSPGKTWEGTIIGVLITFGLSFLFNNLIFDFKNYTWMVLGIIVPVLATVGDLVESKLKREAAIKDSGSIMPGHGGVLDRFDSLIFVSPFVYVYFKLFYTLI
ncbi:MAG: phosphatidate cytidylyltransferase [Bacteroidetes bacterium]|nr:phosphatidate cytidylyltransferase [Bacteroidota bacterium]